MTLCSNLSVVPFFLSALSDIRPLHRCSILDFSLQPLRPSPHLVLHLRLGKILRIFVQFCFSFSLIFWKCFRDPRAGVEATTDGEGRHPPSWVARGRHRDATIRDGTTRDGMKRRRDATMAVTGYREGDPLLMDPEALESRHPLLEVSCVFRMFLILCTVLTSAFRCTNQCWGSGSDLPHPDSLVSSTDPDPDPSSSSKNNKKNFGFYCFATSIWLFMFEEWCTVNVPMFWIRISSIRMFLGLPDPLVRALRIRIHSWIRTKMSLIPNTGTTVQSILKVVLLFIFISSLLCTRHSEASFPYNMFYLQISQYHLEC